MGTSNTDFLPNATGLNLGSPDQEWDGFFNNVSIANNLTVGGVLAADGNALKLQGTPISSTPPTLNQMLLFDGLDWVPSYTVNATQIQGFPVDAGVPALDQVLVWDGAKWAPANQTGGGGGGATLGYVAVGFSATPTFTAIPVGSCTFAIVLTGDVTSSTFTTTGLTAGCIFNFSIQQDGVGGHTFAWPALAKGAQPVATGPNLTTVQNFFWDGTNLNATGSPAVFF